MRTTVTIDDDVLRAAKHRAAATGESLGRAISELARAGLTATKSSDATRVRNGITLLPVNENAIGATLEEVTRLQDEPL